MMAGSAFYTAWLDGKLDLAQEALTVKWLVFARIATSLDQAGRYMKWYNGKQLGMRVKDPVLRDWLLDRGSLTDRLLARSQGHFHVELISQRRGVARLDESRALGLRPREAVIIREVILCGNSQPWVFARSILPEKSLSRSLRYLKRLGRKPLGAVLFADPHLRRGPIEFTQHQAADLAPHAPRGAWGRRSVFYLHNQPLLVSEVFLPHLLS